MSALAYLEYVKFKLIILALRFRRKGVIGAFVARQGLPPRPRSRCAPLKAGCRARGYRAALRSTALGDPDAVRAVGGRLAAQGHATEDVTRHGAGKHTQRVARCLVRFSACILGWSNHAAALWTSMLGGAPVVWASDWAAFSTEIRRYKYIQYVRGLVRIWCCHLPPSPSPALPCRTYSGSRW